MTGFIGFLLVLGSVTERIYETRRAGMISFTMIQKDLYFIVFSFY